MRLVVTLAAVTVGTALGCIVAHAETQTPPTRSEQADAQSIDTGMPVFGKDQVRVGDVDGVLKASDGNLVAILVKTGGFLGFGGKTVSIPAASMSMRGRNVQLSITSQEVNSLPEATPVQ